jgi:hypothetical protein
LTFNLFSLTSGDNQAEKFSEIPVEIAEKWGYNRKANQIL